MLARLARRRCGPVRALPRPVRPLSSSGGNQQQREGQERRKPRKSHITKPWLALGAVTVFGAAVAKLYAHLKEEQMQSNAQVHTTSVGKAKIGGDFELVDSKGRPVSSKDFRGQYMLIYFGFTKCPDICPTELHKMGDALAKVEAEAPRDVRKQRVQPLFITVDPRRDTGEVMEAYGKDFYPGIRWLTGSDEAILSAAKAFRVYFSVPDDQDGDDYLVDHSIFFFLMGRDGQFLEFFGKNLDADEVAAKMTAAIQRDVNMNGSQ